MKTRKFEGTHEEYEAARKEQNEAKGSGMFPKPTSPPQDAEEMAEGSHCTFCNDDGTCEGIQRGYSEKEMQEAITLARQETVRACEEAVEKQRSRPSSPFAPAEQMEGYDMACDEILEALSTVADRWGKKVDDSRDKS